jgi:hypothetical protein
MTYTVKVITVRLKKRFGLIASYLLVDGSEIGLLTSGLQRKGKDMTGKVRNGQERTGKDRKGQERTGKDREEQGRTKKNREGQDQVGKGKGQARIRRGRPG